MCLSQAPGWSSPSYASMCNPAQTLSTSDRWTQPTPADTALRYHPSPIYGLSAGVPSLAGQLGPDLGQVGDVGPLCHAATSDKSAWNLQNFRMPTLHIELLLAERQSLLLVDHHGILAWLPPKVAWHTGHLCILCGMQRLSYGLRSFSHPRFLLLLFLIPCIALRCIPCKG